MTSLTTVITITDIHQFQTGVSNSYTSSFTSIDLKICQRSLLITNKYRNKISTIPAIDFPWSGMMR